MNTPTIYPPLSELTFRLIKTVAGYKWLFTALDLASAGVLLLLLAARHQPLHRVLIYAWNPTVITAFALELLRYVHFSATLFEPRKHGLSIPFLWL